MGKGYSNLQQCIKCYRIEIFDDIKFVGYRIKELYGKDICTECYPELKKHLISQRHILSKDDKEVKEERKQELRDKYLFY